MDLHHYYKEHKDEINSLIMEIASDLAVGRLVAKHGQPFEAFVEPDDPKDPDSGTHYKEEFQDEFNRFYDEEYERVASLMRFDIGTEDGLRRSDADDTIASLVFRANAWQKEARERIVETLRQHGGRVTYTPENEDDEYPVTASFHGRHDHIRLNVTDVYLEDATCIIADGIDMDHSHLSANPQAGLYGAVHTGHMGTVGCGRAAGSDITAGSGHGNRGCITPVVAGVHAPLRAGDVSGRIGNHGSLLYGRHRRE